MRIPFFSSVLFYPGFFHGLLALACLQTLTVGAQEYSRPSAAQQFGAARKRLAVQPDGLLVCEAEEFQPSKGGGWVARNYGENYFAATFANSFLSRKAFLGAPENGPATEASMQLSIPGAGRYLVLSRYEAAYRFETQFNVRIEQGGKVVFERLYGARDNLKIWAFKERLKTEVGWSWGASENVVWEGHDAFALLEKGDARVVLVAGPQPEPAARRNVDLVMLTTDVAQVTERIEKENYLPLDGMLTQSGDVWLRVRNTGAEPLTFQSHGKPGSGNWREHSPYWVHMRKWPAPHLDVAPHTLSDWVDVGATMDSLADGQWVWSANGTYEAEFAVRTPGGAMERIGLFSGSGELHLAGACDTRYSRKLLRREDVLPRLLETLSREPMAGRAPVKTPVYAHTFEPIAGAVEHNAALEKFRALFGIVEPVPGAPGGKGYVDVRSVVNEKLSDFCRNKLGADPASISVVSLGDEISLPQPVTVADKAAFEDWLQKQGRNPEGIVPFDVSATAKLSVPARYYWSHKYAHAFGIQKIKERTDALRRELPNAGVGANYSPHYPVQHVYLGEAHKWAHVFREGGMTMPWGEDYIWQIPVVSPQVNNLSLDLFRAGTRGNAQSRIHFYVMPHMPNNTPAMWRRLFYGALAHGAKVLNLFEFRTVHAAYTENHVDEPAMYAAVLKGLRELGTFEDVLQAGTVRAAQTGLWFGETADIWGDSEGAFGAAKRALYLAIRHQQVPLDILIEPDAYDGTLDAYKVVYLTDRHVSRDVSEKLALWVQNGGHLFATAGAGMLDETNAPNTVLRTLLGVSETGLDRPKEQQVTWIKQDLPFVSPLTQAGEMQVIGARSRFKAAPDSSVSLRFADGEPAVVQRKTGSGLTTYCGFLPGLSYFKPAIPRRPVDRGASDDAFIHFLPTNFDPAASDLIGAPLEGVHRPVRCQAPLVESSCIEGGLTILVPLINWTREPRKDLLVTVETEATKVVAASGAPVKTRRQGKVLECTLDLDIADALILSK